MELNNTEMKMQYILDENKNLAEIPLTDMRPVEHPIKYKLVSAFEVYVRVPGTENYWISNYGRGVNNYRNSDKNKFYEHKQGQCHYTVYAISRTPEKIRGKLTGEIIVETTKRETCPEELVAKSFLKQYKGRFIFDVTIIKGYNDDEESVEKLKEVIKQISPDKIIVARMDDDIFKKKLGISDEKFREISQELLKK